MRRNMSTAIGANVLKYYLDADLPWLPREFKCIEKGEPRNGAIGYSLLVFCSDKI